MRQTPIFRIAAVIIASIWLLMAILAITIVVMLARAGPDGIARGAGRLAAEFEAARQGHP